MKKCIVNGCNENSFSLGYCHRHYNQFHKHGKITQVEKPATNYGKKNLLNTKIGILEVVRRADEKRSEWKKRGNKCFIWECRCECGNTVFLPTNYLLSGDYMSCGCTQSMEKMWERSKEVMENEIIIEGTNIQTIQRTEPNKNNKLGVRGVYKWIDNKSKCEYFVPNIRFQGKVYRLKYCKTLEEAIQIRKEAEEQLFGNFLEWYNSEYKKDKNKE
jgi:hypothetical protein